MEIWIFSIIGFVTLAASLAVVCFSNPVHSTIALIVSLLGVAGVFAILDAHFLATVQIIVYAGAIVVLVLFVIMLLNLKVEGRGKGAIFQLGFATVLAALFYFAVFPVVLDYFSTVVPETGRLSSNFVPELEGGVKEIGTVLYSRYMVPFEVASVLIMAALVGAVTLGRRSEK